MEEEFPVFYACLVAATCIFEKLFSSLYNSFFKISILHITAIFTLIKLLKCPCLFLPFCPWQFKCFHSGAISPQGRNWMFLIPRSVLGHLCRAFVEIRIHVNKNFLFKWLILNYIFYVTQCIILLVCCKWAISRCLFVP